VVTSDIVTRTDTNDAAHMLLPALGWGEKDGTVTNSERRISRQRAFLPAPGEARADWDILCDVARRMGFAGFDYAGQHEIFDEHARLSAWRNGSGGGDDAAHAPRMFDIGGLAGMDQAAYDAMLPVQWPLPAMASSGKQRLFENARFAFADGRARFVATAARAPVHATDDEFPLILNTGRVRDQWHTMTRTGKAARLSDHLPEPFVDMHPQDALLCGVGEGKLARVTSRWGAMVAASVLAAAFRAAASSCRSTGTTSSAPTRALARWSIRPSIRCRASPSSSTRPCEWRNSACRGTASC
jgi:assimilatory nitrate reductase catalytic subunit